MVWTWEAKSGIIRSTFLSSRVRRTCAAPLAPHQGRCCVWAWLALLPLLALGGQPGALFLPRPFLMNES
jgi:hypothetical protein